MSSLQSAGNPAIAYALQAPPALKPQATADAIQVTMLKKANDMAGKAALQLLIAAIRGTGGIIDTVA